MIFLPTPLAGAVVVDPEPHVDSRGSFARTWCKREFTNAGLNADLVQSSISRNTRAGTLRGMHWQAYPYEEAKLVRCIRGAIYDVIIDLRPTSPTYMMHCGFGLDAKSGRALYIPEGFAHGFVTLEDDSEILYQMTNYYEPSAARGARWNDPAFGISWPVENPILHSRDASYPDFAPATALANR